jgi:long-chain fatty acid transport protein
MSSHTSRFFRQTVLAAVVAGIGTPASAAFFQLAENSGSGMGNAFAGGAASAEDASTVWYNPAGMTRLKGQQFVFAGHYIDPSFKASVNSASTVNFGAGNLPISGGGGDAGQSKFVPNIYYTRPISNDFSVGAGINAPFGLATQYDSSWAGRYHAIRSEISSYNLNFAGAYKVSDLVSAGAGINYQHLDAELTQAIDFATLCSLAGQSATCGVGAGFNPGTNPNDGFGKVTASGNAWGYNFGILANLQDDLRVGFAYRSKIKHKLTGDFDATPGAPGGAATVATAGVASGLGIVDSSLKADVTLPATLSLSAYKQLGSQWALMADVTRTNWSSLPELRIQFDSAQNDSVVTLNLKDVYRYSVGATYKPGGAWVFRGGIALDQTPVKDQADNTPRLPDADRTWFALGAGIQATPALSFDVGYTYIKLDNPTVRKTATLTNENVARGNLSVDYKGTVQVLSAQARWAF